MKHIEASLQSIWPEYTGTFESAGIVSLGSRCLGAFKKHRFFREKISSNPHNFGLDDQIKWLLSKKIPRNVSVVLISRAI